MALSFSLIIHNFTLKLTKNTISNWYESESVNLQQGNFISSVTKLERIINNPGSDIAGVRLLEYKNGLVRNLLNLGNNFPTYEKLVVSNFGVYTNIFTLDYVVYIFLNSDLILFVNFKPKFNQYLLAAVSFYFFVISFFFNKLSFNHYRSLQFYKKKVKAQRTKVRQITNRQIHRLSKKVAHDIKSPLSTLSLISSKIQDEEFKSLQISVIDQISQIADNLLVKTRKINGSSASAEFAKSISFSELFRQIYKENQLKNSSRLINVIFEISSEVEEVSSPAPVFLYSGLNNLLQNSEEAGVDLSRAEIKFLVKLSSNSKLEIKIIDNGCGIPADVLSVLGKKEISFGKTSSVSGQGIGVYNTYQQVVSAGGQMQIESEVGKGTTVTISLPVTTFL